MKVAIVILAAMLLCGAARAHVIPFYGVRRPAAPGGFLGGFSGFRGGLSGFRGGFPGGVNVGYPSDYYGDFGGYGDYLYDVYDHPRATGVRTLSRPAVKGTY